MTSPGSVLLSLKPPPTLWEKKKKTMPIWENTEENFSKKDTEVKMCYLQSKNRDSILITINCSLISYPYPESGLLQSRTIKETLWSIGKLPLSVFNAFPIVSSCSTDLCRVLFPTGPQRKFCSLNLLCSPLESHWTFLATNKLNLDEWAWVALNYLPFKI